jgi:hypothetical protein
LFSISFFLSRLTGCLSQGYYEEAMNNIKKIQAGLVKPKEYSYSDIKLPPPPEKVGLFAPFAKNYLRITVALIIICFCTSGLSYGITTWMPSLLLQSGLNLSTSYGYATFAKSCWCIWLLCCWFCC